MVLIYTLASYYDYRKEVEFTVIRSFSSKEKAVDAFVQYLKGAEDKCKGYDDDYNRNEEDEPMYRYTIFNGKWDGPEGEYVYPNKAILDGGIMGSSTRYCIFENELD